MKRISRHLALLLLATLLASCASLMEPPQATPTRVASAGTHAAAATATDTVKTPPSATASLRPSYTASPQSSDTPPPEPTATSAPEETDTPAPSPSSAPSPTSTPVPPTLVPPTLAAPLPAELAETMDAIEQEMEVLRGLEEMEPIDRSLMTREELGAYLEHELQDEYPPKEIAADVRVLAAFGFVPADYDLQGLLMEMYSTQILGLYDDDEDVLYVVTDDEGAARGELSLMDRITFAHEYTHGLQDEHFGLDSFIDEDRLNDDEILARMSLVEGDATLAMTDYLVAHRDEITPQDMEALQGEGSEAGLPDAPAIIVETFEFPYAYGLEFVSALQVAGWDAVDAAFADPPRSTEQILHPEKYFARDEPQIVSLPPLTDTLGAGWHLVEAETLGEFQTRLYLETRVAPDLAALASEGWDGDRYAVYVNDGTDLLVFSTTWDSAADREEFVDAYTVFAEGRYRALGSTGTEETWWEADLETTVLNWGDSTALLVVGPDRKTVERVLAETR